MNDIKSAKTQIEPPIRPSGLQFQFEGSEYPVRSDLCEAYRKTWQHIGTPGTWLSGRERVAVAAESRRARTCALCRERKNALSPNAVEGRHQPGGGLPELLVDAVHRVTTDCARLSEAWYRSLLDGGIAAEIYVEALGVAVLTISVDRFHHAIGQPLEALRTPVDGEPSHERPERLVDDEAWVPMQTGPGAAKAAGLEARTVPFVVRALSLVPSELRAWQALSSAQYLEPSRILDLASARAIDRPQIELVASRVSRLNDCFY